MPSIIFDDVLSDAGDSILGGSRVFYVAWEVTTDGPAVHLSYSWDPYTTVGAGYWQLGNDLTPGGLITGLGWDQPHWFNQPIGQWIAPPGVVGADFSAAIAQYVRWAISPGTTVHLIVFGDV